MSFGRGKGQGKNNEASEDSLVPDLNPQQTQSSTSGDNGNGGSGSSTFPKKPAKNPVEDEEEEEGEVEEEVKPTKRKLFQTPKNLQSIPSGAEVGSKTQKRSQNTVDPSPWFDRRKQDDIHKEIRSLGGGQKSSDIFERQIEDDIKEIDNKVRELLNCKCFTIGDAYWKRRTLGSKKAEEIVLEKLAEELELLGKFICLVRKGKQRTRNQRIDYSLVGNSLNCTAGEFHYSTSDTNIGCYEKLIKTVEEKCTRSIFKSNNFAVYFTEDKLTINYLCGMMQARPQECFSSYNSLVDDNITKGKIDDAIILWRIFYLFIAVDKPKYRLKALLELTRLQLLISIDFNSRRTKFTKNKHLRVAFENAMRGLQEIRNYDENDQEKIALQFAKYLLVVLIAQKGDINSQQEFKDLYKLCDTIISELSINLDCKPILPKKHLNKVKDLENISSEGKKELSVILGILKHLANFYIDKQNKLERHKQKRKSRSSKHSKLDLIENSEISDAKRDLELNLIARIYTIRQCFSFLSDIMWLRSEPPVNLFIVNKKIQSFVGGFADTAFGICKKMMDKNFNRSRGKNMPFIDDDLGRIIVELFNKALIWRVNFCKDSSLTMIKEQLALVLEKFEVEQVESFFDIRVMRSFSAYTQNVLKRLNGQFSEKNVKDCCTGKLFVTLTNSIQDQTHSFICGAPNVKNPRSSKRYSQDESVAHGYYREHYQGYLFARFGYLKRAIKNIIRKQFANKSFGMVLQEISKLSTRSQPKDISSAQSKTKKGQVKKNSMSSSASSNVKLSLSSVITEDVLTSILAEVKKLFERMAFDLFRNYWRNVSFLSFRAMRYIVDVCGADVKKFKEKENFMGKDDLFPVQEGKQSFLTVMLPHNSGTFHVCYKSVEEVVRDDNGKAIKLPDGSEDKCSKVTYTQTEKPHTLELVGNGEHIPKWTNANSFITNEFKCLIRHREITETNFCDALLGVSQIYAEADFLPQAKEFSALFALCGMFFTHTATGGSLSTTINYRVQNDKGEEISFSHTSYFEGDGKNEHQERLNKIAKVKRYFDDFADGQAILKKALSAYGAIISRPESDMFLHLLYEICVKNNPQCDSTFEFLFNKGGLNAMVTFPHGCHDQKWKELRELSRISTDTEECKKIQQQFQKIRNERFRIIREKWRWICLILLKLLESKKYKQTRTAIQELLDYKGEISEEVILKLYENISLCAGQDSKDDDETVQLVFTLSQRVCNVLQNLFEIELTMALRQDLSFAKMRYDWHFLRNKVRKYEFSPENFKFDISKVKNYAENKVKPGMQLRSGLYNMLVVLIRTEYLLAKNHCQLAAQKILMLEAYRIIRVAYLDALYDNQGLLRFFQDGKFPLATLAQTPFLRAHKHSSVIIRYMQKMEKVLSRTKYKKDLQYAALLLNLAGKKVFFEFLADSAANLVRDVDNTQNNMKNKVTHISSLILLARDFVIPIQLCLKKCGRLKKYKDRKGDKNDFNHLLELINKHINSLLSDNAKRLKGHCDVIINREISKYEKVIEYVDKEAKTLHFLVFQDLFSRLLRGGKNIRSNDMVYKLFNAVAEKLKLPKIYLDASKMPFEIYQYIWVDNVVKMLDKKSSSENELESQWGKLTLEITKDAVTKFKQRFEARKKNVAKFDLSIVRACRFTKNIDSNGELRGAQKLNGDNCKPLIKALAEKRIILFHLPQPEIAVIFKLLKINHNFTAPKSPINLVNDLLKLQERYLLELCKKPDHNMVKNIFQVCAVQTQWYLEHYAQNTFDYFLIRIRSHFLNNLKADSSTYQNIVGEFYRNHEKFARQLIYFNKGSVQSINMKEFDKLMYPQSKEKPENSTNLEQGLDDTTPKHRSSPGAAYNV